MKFSEWQEDKIGLFEVMHSINELPFFNDYPPDKVDILFQSMFNNKTLSSVFHEKSMIETVTILVLRFGEKWNGLYQWFNINHPLNASSIDDFEETINVLNTNDRNTTNTEFESAYNSDNFVNAGKNESVEGDQFTGERTRTHKQTRQSLQALTIRRSMLEKEVFIDNVFKDIVNMLCLAVY